MEPDWYARVLGAAGLVAALASLTWQILDARRQRARLDLRVEKLIDTTISWEKVRQETVVVVTAVNIGIRSTVLNQLGLVILVPERNRQLWFQGWLPPKLVRKSIRQQPAFEISLEHPIFRKRSTVLPTSLGTGQEAQVVYPLRYVLSELASSRHEFPDFPFGGSLYATAEASTAKTRTAVDLDEVRTRISIGGSVAENVDIDE